MDLQPRSLARRGVAGALLVAFVVAFVALTGGLGSHVWSRLGLALMIALLAFVLSYWPLRRWYGIAPQFKTEFLRVVYDDRDPHHPVMIAVFAVHNRGAAGAIAGCELAFGAASGAPAQLPPQHALDEIVWGGKVRTWRSQDQLF